MSRGGSASSAQVRRSKPDLPPRERILAAARALFYARGIRAVSVDEIAAAAGTNKMTLYRHFESKDRLVAEYLRGLARRSEVGFEALLAAHPGNPEGALRAWIANVGGYLCKEGERGCALANAAVELPDPDHPARAVIEEFKTGQRNRLVKLCVDGGFAEPERLADEIFLLLEGARVNVQTVGNCGPGARFTEMATDLVSRHSRK
jgi:AcrR family transcriptional regulator